MKNACLYFTRRDFLALVGTGAAGALFSLAQPRSAHALASNARNITLAGKTVICSAHTFISSGNAVSSASTDSLSGTGYFGAYTVLYNDSGISLNSNLRYDGPGTNANAEVQYPATSGRSYNSMAVSYVWNSSTQSYEDNFYNPVWSPYETAYALTRPYPTNPQGKTYGPVTGLATHGYLPDLISVIGVNGEEGYVEKDDFLPPAATNPEDAAANFAIPQVDYVPVYDVNMSQQIDTFAVHYGG